MRALVLRGRVVPPLARGAREGDDLPHRLLRDLRDDAGPHRPPPLPDRQPPRLHHRHPPLPHDHPRPDLPTQHLLPPPRPHPHPPPLPHPRIPSPPPPAHARRRQRTPHP